MGVLIAVILTVFVIGIISLFILIRSRKNITYKNRQPYSDATKIKEKPAEIQNAGTTNISQGKQGTWKRAIGCSSVFVIALVLVIIFTLNSHGEPNKDTYYGPEVEYEITGTADKVDVTLNNSSGGTEQYDNVYLPMTYSYYNFSDNFLYISAQNQGEYGTVKVSIYVDGHLYKTSSSSGAYVIATASGSK